jgi:hypothetical protein
MIKKITMTSNQPSGERAMRQSGGLEKQMHFDHQEDSKIESSSFNSEVKRIETQQTFNSSSTIIRRDRGASGVSGTSQNSERTT